MKRVTMVGLGIVAVGSVALAASAQAAPLSPGLVGSFESDARIERVRDGCGYRGHRNVYGECRADLPSRPRYGYGVYGGGGGYGYGRPRGYGGYGYGGPRPY